MIYRLDRMSAYVGRTLDLDDESTWLDFLDDFGPVLSRFLINPAIVSRLPTRDPVLSDLRRTLMENPLSRLKPRPGSVWILFAFKGTFTKLPSLFRPDGILLPFEWRRENEVKACLDTGRLPESLVKLSQQVQTLFGASGAGWSLGVDRCFGGQVDLNLSGVTFESGWGALATGLARSLDKRLVTGEWPFSSIAWNPVTGSPSPVGELARKFQLAAELGAEEFAVAPEQRREATRLLAELKSHCAQTSALRRLRIFDWSYKRDEAIESLRRLCYCNAYRRGYRFLRLCVRVISLLIGIIGVIGVLVWDATRQTVEYYADYVETGGSVRGLFPLAKRPTHATCYEFQRQGWASFIPRRRGERLLRSVRFINAQGEMREDVNDYPEHRSFARRTFSYDEQGRLVLSICYGAGNRFLGSLRYSGEKAEIADAMQGGSRYIDGYAFATGGDRVRRLRYVYDRQGEVSEIDFIRDSGDIAAEDAAGISKIRFERDELGRILSQSYCNWRGEAASTQTGIHRVVYNYDGPFLVSMRRYDVSGKAQCAADGGDEMVYSYSEEGNLIKREMRANGTNVNTIVYGYNEKGDRVRVCYRDGANRPRLSPWTERHMVYDATGNLICESWLDEMGNPLTRDSNHPAVIRRSYDENGLLREEIHLDDVGRLFANQDGWARRSIQTVSHAGGTLIDRRYFGERNEPVLAGHDRLARERKFFDEAGRLAIWELFGINEEPVEGLDGWHRAVMRYSREGRREKLELYDKKGELINEEK